MNSTLHTTGYAASLLDSVQDHVAASPGRAVLLTLLYSPIVAIVLNVLRQLLWPRDRSLPPEVFHWIPIVGSSISYGHDPLGFFFKCREKYGDVFTFILFGRKVTVALGPKGNNFVLGGKSTFFSAVTIAPHDSSLRQGRRLRRSKRCVHGTKEVCESRSINRKFPGLRQHDRGRGGTVYEDRPGFPHLSDERHQ